MLLLLQSFALLRLVEVVIDVVCQGALQIAHLADHLIVLLLDALYEVIALFILARLDQIALELFVGHHSLLSVLDPVLVRLQLCQGLFFQFALLLPLEVVHNLVIPLAVEDQLLAINLILKSLVKLIGLAFVGSFVHVNAFLLDLLLVHIVLIVVGLLVVLLLYALQSIILLPLKLVALLLRRQLLFMPLLFEPILVLHVFGAHHIASHAQLQLFLRLALLHARLDLIQLPL